MEGVNDALKLIAQAIELLKVYDDDNAEKVTSLLQEAIDKLAPRSM